MRVTAAASCLTLLVPRVAGWSKGDPCPTEIRVTIPNADTHKAGREGMSRFSYWDFGYLNFGYYDDENEDDEPRPASFATVAEVHEALVSCPDVKVLDLRTAMLGCTDMPDRDNLPFNLAGGETYPALEELSLDGYYFTEREWNIVEPTQTLQLPGGLPVPDEIPAQQPLQEDEVNDESWLRHWAGWFSSGKARRYMAWRRLSAEQRAKTNLELWFDAMDFSKIHSLAIKEDQRNTDAALVERLPSMLTSLRSLSLVGGWRDGENPKDGDPWPARDFILNVSPEAPLTHLSWMEAGTTDDEIFTDILKRHGSTLTSLEWRNSEMEMPRRPMLSSEQIRKLATLAPSLQSLSIDMNRKNGLWPGEISLLANSLPRLTNLTVYFEFQSECRLKWNTWWQYKESELPPCEGADQVAHPLLKVSSATDLFKKLRLARKREDEELTTVTFRQGDWTRPYDGPLQMPEWLERKRIWVECSVLNEDGTRKGDGDTLCSGDAIV